MSGQKSSPLRTFANSATDAAVGRFVLSLQRIRPAAAVSSTDRSQGSACRSVSRMTGNVPSAGEESSPMAISLTDGRRALIRRGC